MACCCSEDPWYSRQRPTERKRSMHPKLLLSKELYKRRISVLANLQHSWDLGTPEAWNGLRRAGKLAAATENLQYHKQTQEGARGYEHLKKEASKSLWLGIYTNKSREDISTQKVWEAPRFSGRTDGKDLFFYKEKTGRWFFCKCMDLSTKFQGAWATAKQGLTKDTK